MVVNDNAGYLDASGAWTTIASVLAPTGSAKLPQWQSFNHSYHEDYEVLALRHQTALGVFTYRH